MKGERAHHLAKHCLSGEIDLQLHFGTADPKEIGKEVARLGQKQLQAKFNEIFSAKTYSNNNQWLRRKLLEAAGLQAPRSTARGRTAQSKRSPSPADGSAGSSTPSPGAVRGPRAESLSAAARGFLQPINNEVRRTKRKRRPRTFDDMLPLDPPAEANSDVSDAEGAATDPDFDLHGSDGTSPNVRPAKTARSHGPSRPVQWRSHSGSSLSSGMSAQSQLAFANYFEANNQPDCAFAIAHDHYLKNARHHACSDRSQLIRANPSSLSPDMQHCLPQNSYPQSSGNMVVRHYHALQHAAQSGSPPCQYDLGANRVQIATPHGTAAASRVLNMHLLLRQQHAVSSQHTAARRSHAPLGMYTQISSPTMQSQPPLDKSRLEHDGIAGCYEDEAFAVSCLNQHHESLLNDMCDYRVNIAYNAPPTTPAGVMQPSLATPQPEGIDAQGGGSLGSAGSPSASTMHGIDQTPSTALVQSAGPCSSMTDTQLMGTPASTTPMDMIMLQSLTSVPDGELHSSSELLPDSMLLDEAMLGLPIA